MGKQIAYLAFFIALLGQFILAPAMAMPKYLSASSHTHTQQDTATPKSRLIPAEIIQAHGLSLSHTANDDLEMLQLASINPSDNNPDCDPQAVQLSQLTIDCDKVCEQLAAGNCISHCASAPGIIDHSQLAISIQSSSKSIQANFWSLQTVELASKNPPPIYA
ncbi:hypothetical protein [Shewanella pneumatophori]|uniref:Uncharacterized protein n=1 Tax=Shewanella pneumatophori TaxID=314092 RepID=A0A9X1ZLV7_9GAMM|nr:hypothetical protein [Shewanella pneumatophori]MCL1138141.1 hypothetical protein [Shewanella pneumatophori]